MILEKRRGKAPPLFVLGVAWYKKRGIATQRGEQMHSGSLNHANVKGSRRCYVASIILLSPDGKRICLTVSKRAVEDGRLNQSPLQSRVKDGETVRTAVERKLLESLKVVVDSPLLLLSTLNRTLPDNHHRRGEYDSYRYFCVATFAKGYQLYPCEELAEARWHHLDHVDYQVSCMSDQKGSMFRAALSSLRQKTGDPLLIRKKVLFPVQRPVEVV